MKWYILALISLTAFVVSSCQSDEEAMMDDYKREMKRIEEGKR